MVIIEVNGQSQHFLEDMMKVTVETSDPTINLGKIQIKVDDEVIIGKTVTTWVPERSSDNES